jgi:hypothetical protein
VLPRCERVVSMRVGNGQGVQAALPAGLETSARWSARERASVYERVVGAPGGDAGGIGSNREFDDLWLRFVVSVAQFERKDPKSPMPGPSVDSVLRAARELAADVVPRIDSAWSKRDQWSVIDSVNTAELGGAVNTAQHRSLAQSGGAILEWLSAHRDDVGGPGGRDYDLVNAAEQWLAHTGVAEESVEHCAQPPESPARLADWSRALFKAVGLDDRAGSATGESPPRLTALFTGASGTGKTLAAHWLAGSLGRDLLHIDVAQVVSKYIGETEKNLDRVFSSAQKNGSVLLLDEADALFGKRTEVRDAHDRYANLDVNALLQRIEGAAGVTLLATNAQPPIDPDLLRRVDAKIVVFPFPSR